MLEGLVLSAGLHESSLPSHVLTMLTGEGGEGGGGGVALQVGR